MPRIREIRLNGCRRCHAPEWIDHHHLKQVAPDTNRRRQYRDPNAYAANVVAKRTRAHRPNMGISRQFRRLSRVLASKSDFLSFLRNRRRTCKSSFFQSSLAPNPCCPATVNQGFRVAGRQCAHAPLQPVTLKPCYPEPLEPCCTVAGAG